MRKNLILTAALVLLAAALFSIAQTQIQSPALPNRTYTGGAQPTGRLRPIAGINSNGDIQIDPDAVGLQLGALITAAAVTTPANRLYFNGTPQFVGPLVDVIFCGDFASAGTVYTSPASGYASAPMNDLGGSSFLLAGAGCSAEDSATETTADEVMFLNNAFKVLSLYCQVDSTGTGGVLFSLRSAAAELTSPIQLKIATARTSAATNVVTTTDIAAGATVALRAVSYTDLSSNDFWCNAKIMLVP